MYTAFYGLREKPFSLTPNPRFLFLAESHREALAHLLYGLEQGEGFIVVAGEVGTGKTTICRTLLERLGVETELAFLFNPSGSADEMLQTVNEEFGLPAKGLSRRELLSQLNRFLLEKNRESKRVVLIIDEAQNLSTTTLEQVRLLSNLETTTSKLIQIILLGQPELGEKLDSEELRQLRQRIGVRWHLSPLSVAETAQYVRHRLRVAAGADRSALFEDAALVEAHKRTGGVPRLLNVLCDRALLAGYAAESPVVDVGLVKQAAREIRDLRDEAFGRSGRRGRGRGRDRGAGGGVRWWTLPLVAAGAALAVGAGVWLGQAGGGRAVRGWLDGAEILPPPVSSRGSSDSARGGTAGPGAASADASAAGPGRDPMPAAGSGLAPIAEPEPPSLDRVSSAASGSLPIAATQRAPAAAEDRLPPVSARGPAAARPAAESLAGASGSETPGALGLASDAARPSLSRGAGDAGFLSYLLGQGSTATSRSLAVTEILHAWGKPPIDDVSRTSADGRSDGAASSSFARLEEAGLALHAVSVAHVEDLGAFDRPALIEVRNDAGEARWLALVELQPPVAFVGGLVDRGPVGVSLDALATRFDGRAHVVWSPGVELDGAPLLSAGSAGPPVRWLRQALIELGYLDGTALDEAALAGAAAAGLDDVFVYDAAIRRGVRRFQRAQGLNQDGITGPITLMRLDDALGRRPRPHLGTGGAG